MTYPRWMRQHRRPRRGLNALLGVYLKNVWGDSTLLANTKLDIAAHENEVLGSRQIDVFMDFTPVFSWGGNLGPSSWWNNLVAIQNWRPAHPIKLLVTFQSVLDVVVDDQTTVTWAAGGTYTAGQTKKVYNAANNHLYSVVTTHTAPAANSSVPATLTMDLSKFSDIGHITDPACFNWFGGDIVLAGQGLYNERWRACLQRGYNAGVREMWVRHDHEMGGDYYRHSLGLNFQFGNSAYNDPDGGAKYFKMAHAHYDRIAREVGITVHSGVNIQVGDAKSGKRASLPVVNLDSQTILTVDMYDQGYSIYNVSNAPDPAYTDGTDAERLVKQKLAWTRIKDGTSTTLGMDDIAEYCRARGLKFWLAEWGPWLKADGGGGGDNPYFAQALFDWAAQNADVVENMTNFDFSNGGAVTVLNGISDATTNRLTFTAHGLTEGWRFHFPILRSAPGGLQSNRYLYVRNPTTNDFQVSLTKTGAILDITENKTGLRIYKASTSSGDSFPPAYHRLFQNGSGTPGPGTAFVSFRNAYFPAALDWVNRASKRRMWRDVTGTTGIVPVNSPFNRVVRTGKSLSVNGVPWRGSGVNWHWAGLRETTLTQPTHAQIDSVLDECVALGANVVRAHTLGIQAGFTGALIANVSGSNATLTLSQAATPWDAIDYVVAGCRARGLRLSIPFSDQHNGYHLGKLWWVQKAFENQSVSGIPSTYTYSNGAGGTTTETGVTSVGTAEVSSSPRQVAISQQFYKNPWIVNAFTQYINYWFDHVNSYTGVVNSDEPAIAFVSAGNEMWDSGDERPDHANAAGIAWARQMSMVFKTAAPYVLVIDPQGTDGYNINNAPGRNDPNTDILDYHLYNGGALVPTGLTASLAAKMAAFDKVGVFQEYAYTNDGIENILSEIETAPNVAFGMFWAIYTSTEPHTSTGAVDSVYTVGAVNDNWKARFHTHAAIMATGTVPTAAAPINTLASIPAALTTAPLSFYASNAFSGAVPALSILATADSSGGPALQANLSSSAHQWIYITDQSAASPVTPGVPYTMSVDVKLSAGTPVSGGFGHIIWRRADGSFLSGDTALTSTVLHGSWLQVTFSAVAPAEAAFALPQFEIDGPTTGTAVLLFDRWGIFPGYSASPYVPPVTPTVVNNGLVTSLVESLV